MLALKKMWKNDYFKTVVAIVLIIAVVLGLFFGLQIGLHTSYPALTVISGSMSIPYGASDDNFWLSISHPFDRTLSVGDIVIVEGVNPKDLNSNYPNSDIIIFHSPIDGELIVHRIVSEETVNGTIYFQTKGDGTATRGQHNQHQVSILGTTTTHLVFLKTLWSAKWLCVFHGSDG